MVKLRPAFGDGAYDFLNKRRPAICIQYFLMLFPLAFDFRSSGPGEGALIQGGLFLLFLLQFLLLIRNLAQLPCLSFGRLFEFSIGLFWLIGVIVGFCNGQRLYAILAASIPTIIYGASYYATKRLILTLGPADVVVLLFSLLCLLFVPSRLLLTALSSGIDFDNVRFEILGPSMIPALGLVACATMVRISRVDIISSALNGLIILLSVTRSTFVILVGQFVVVLPVLLLRFSILKLFRLFILALFVLLVLGADAFLGLGQVARWSERMHGSELGVDNSLLTRYAEVEFMWDSFLRSPLLGNGMAAETALVGDAAEEVAEREGTRESIEIYSIGFGHNNYVSLLFVAGVTGGAPLLLGQLLQGWAAMTNFLQIGVRDPVRNLVFLSFWGATIVVGFLIYGLFAGTLGDRGSALWYGIGSGMLVASRICIAQFGQISRDPGCS